MNTTTKILIDELIEQGHLEKVENVIYHALKDYAANNKQTWPGTIASCITQRIEDEQAQNAPVLMNESRIKTLFE